MVQVAESDSHRERVVVDPVTERHWLVIPVDEGHWSRDRYSPLEHSDLERTLERFRRADS